MNRPVAAAVARRLRPLPYLPPHPSHSVSSSATAPTRPLRRHYSPTPQLGDMPPGTPIPGLESLYPPPKNPSDPSRAPVALKREDYPAWVGKLTQPLPSLAKLRAMKIEDSSDRDMKRYLRLVRKAKIKQNNQERAKK